MEYVVDLRGVETPEGFQERVREALPVPAWYGGNLDALHDVLAEGGAGWTVRFLHAGALREACPRYAAALERLCAAAGSEVPGLRLSLSD